MHKVSHILSRKNAEPVSVTATCTVLDALAIMSKRNIGSVVVTGEHGRFLGIVTERDYSRKIMLEGKNSMETTVEEIMSTNMKPVSPTDTVEHCMELMMQDNVRYLPVFEQSHLKGIVSMSDVVKETILMQQETIKHLEHYINL